MVVTTTPPGTGPTARRQQRGRIPVDIPQLRVGVADQLPAARRFAWIDAAELAGQPDRAGGHLGPRLRSPRHVEPFVAADQVGETRCETTESDPPQGAVCAATTSPGIKSGQPADLVEVGAVVDDVDHDVGAAVGGRGRLRDALRRQLSLLSRCRVGAW